MVALTVGANSCNKNNWQPNTFPTGDFTYVTAYKMTGEYGRVIEEGKVSSKTIGKGKKLSFQETTTLLSTFFEPSTYGDISARCFEPHVGYIFYNAQDQVVGHATICLSCGNMYTTPDIGNFVLSSEGIDKLANLEKRVLGE